MKIKQGTVRSTQVCFDSPAESTLVRFSVCETTSGVSRYELTIFAEQGKAMFFVSSAERSIVERALERKVGVAVEWLMTGRDGAESPHLNKAAR